MLFIKILFWTSLFLIFWAMIGYPMSIMMIGKIIKKRKVSKNAKYTPRVSVLIVAHNEEKVIEEKLNNVCKLDYDKKKLEIVVASDNSSDSTNEIVEDFITKNPTKNIRLYKTVERKGKTNAQNEAVRTIDSEIIIFTDANSMLKANSVKELVASFSTDDISYVSGRLVYVNSAVNETSQMENTYWDMDTRIRDIESRLQTITAGNGALYACRRSDYFEFDPIKCHDSAMPLYYALKHKRAIVNHEAIAYEKAGENVEDEFKRKVRMARIVLSSIVPDIRIFNVFKYKWFSYFYFGHRTCRYLLWLLHPVVFISNMFLLDQLIYFIAFVLQCAFYLSALISAIFKNRIKILSMPYYYVMTVVAQLIGVKNVLTGQAKPFWEKAESTR